MGDLTISELLSGSLFVVADEDRWPGLIAGVTGAYISVYTWDEISSTLGMEVDVFDAGRFDGIYAAQGGSEVQADETIKERFQVIERVLDRIMEGENEDSD